MIRLSIRRPVAVAMAYTAVALLGVFAWRNIPIELLPDTQLPRLTVSGSWDGSSPETVEAFLTSPLESTIQQIRGVEKVTSRSVEGSTSISIEFDRDTDMDFARLDLSERITQLEDELPDGIGRITVSPYVPDEFADQTRPFLQYTFTGPYTLEALQLHLDEVVVPELSQVEGVALVEARGARRRVLEIRVDEAESRAIGLSPFQVQAAIAELDLVREAGVIRQGEQERTVTVVNRPQSAADIADAVLTTLNGRIIRVADVATISDTFEEARGYQRINGSAAVQLQLIKEIGSNTVRVAEAARAKMAELERLNPYGSRFILNNDESEEIEEQLTDLRGRALVAAGVIFVVLLVFLGSLRSAGLIFATIAFSVLISLNLIYFGGLTLNLLTLMGLALGFGLIVDNSIVVLENVFRRWQGGEGAEAAAEEGAREVVLPIFASTATTLIVFVPFVYLQGELRVFYVPLAIVVALTLTASIFVAFTFIPSLSARWLRKGPRRALVPITSVAGASGGAGSSDAPASDERPPLYVRFYAAVVGFNMRHPWIAIFVTLGVFGLSWYGFDNYVTRGRVWAGGGSGSTYITINVSLPRGSNLERTDQLVRFFEDKLALEPTVEQYVSNVSETRGTITVEFPDSLENTSVPPAVKDEMYAYSHTFTGADVRVYGYGPSFYGGGGSPPTYSIQVRGYNFEKVREIAEDLGRRLIAIPRVVEVDTNASGGFTRDKAVEYVVSVDRAALARYDMTMDDFQRQVRTAVATEGGGGRLKLGGEEVDYEVKIRDVESQDVLALRETILTTPDGRGIRLGDVASIAPRDVLATILREDQQYERTVAYEFRGPNKLGEVYQDLIIERTELPPGYEVAKRDRFRWSSEERSQIYLVLGVSLILIYMVTSALFESLKLPLTVLLTVPMALIGVFGIFFFTNATFTREAYVGVIMMGGIVVNNAILLVDHVNRVRETRELSLFDSIMEGTLERVRPILMTTATTVFGLLPLVLFADSADSTIWNALAYTLIGGLLSSTLFVLTITPALYWLFERGAEARRLSGAGMATPSEADDPSRGPPRGPGIGGGGMAPSPAPGMP
jgi:HAE1 family hydrophobic/amphiphilic exporter-1